VVAVSSRGDSDASAVLIACPSCRAVIGGRHVRCRLY